MKTVKKVLQVVVGGPVLLFSALVLKAQTRSQGAAWSSKG